MSRRSRSTSPAMASQKPSRKSSSSSRAAPASTRAVRLGVFAVLAVVIGGLALWLAVSRLLPPAVADARAIQVHASMGGFDPASMRVRVGETVRVELASMDTSMHSDGGGWHQLAIDALGIDWKVGPQSSKVFEFQAPDQPGTYGFYCDICCGGKENPSMQGVLTVTA